VARFPMTGSTSSPAPVSAPTTRPGSARTYRKDCTAHLTDVTEEWGTLSLMGPKARDMLSAVTDADVSNTAFPFGHVREIAIAGHRVRACA
jgi:glycine cleavage system aminomethyltransferase T